MTIHRNEAMAWGFNCVICGVSLPDEGSITYCAEHDHQECETCHEYILSDDGICHLCPLDESCEVS